MGTDVKNELKPFSNTVLSKLARIITDFHDWNGVWELFRKAGFPEIIKDSVNWSYSSELDFVHIALQKIQEQSEGPHNVIKVVEALCNPEEFLGDNFGKVTLFTEVNQILQFFGLKVEDNGKVRRINKNEAAMTTCRDEEQCFDDRGFHPEIRKHARQLFREGHYSHAVLECCKALEKLVREKSGIDKNGVELMGAALNLKGPLKINSQSTQSECNEQEGIMHLCIGLMRAIRNPASHEPVLDWSITREDALDLLSFISYLFRRFERAGYTLKEQDKFKDL